MTRRSSAIAQPNGLLPRNRFTTRRHEQPDHPHEQEPAERVQASLRRRAVDRRRAEHRRRAEERRDHGLDLVERHDHADRQAHRRGEHEEQPERRASRSSGGSAPGSRSRGRAGRRRTAPERATEVDQARVDRDDGRDRRPSAAARRTSSRTTGSGTALASSGAGRTPSCDGRRRAVVASGWCSSVPACIAVDLVEMGAPIGPPPARPLGRGPRADRRDGSGTVANGVPESIPPNRASPPSARPAGRSSGPARARRCRRLAGNDELGRHDDARPRRSRSTRRAPRPSPR